MNSDDLFPGAIPREVGRNDLALLLGISPQRVQQLKGEGMPNVAHGRYPLAEAVQWWVTYWKTKGTRSNDHLDSHRKRLLKAQAKKAEIDNEERLKTLIPVDVISATLNQIATITSTQLDSLAPRLASELTNQTETAYVKKIINDETRQIRVAIADTIDDLAVIEDSSGDNTAAAGTNS